MSCDIVLVPGAIGPPGENGAAGCTGPPGADGKDGENGARGEPGQQGPPGQTGCTGETGPQGERGIPGPDGKNGADGAPGSNAVTSVVAPLVLVGGNLSVPQASLMTSGYITAQDYNDVKSALPLLDQSVKTDASPTFNTLSLTNPSRATFIPVTDAYSSLNPRYVIALQDFKTSDPSVFQFAGGIVAAAGFYFINFSAEVLPTTPAWTGSSRIVVSSPAGNDLVSSTELLSSGQICFTGFIELPATQAIVFSLLLTGPVEIITVGSLFECSITRFP